MPRRATSKRTDRAAERKHVRNLRVKRILRVTLKKFHTSIGAKNLDEAKKLIVQAFKQLDKAAKHNIMHSNTADRTKSRLAAKLRKAA